MVPSERLIVGLSSGTGLTGVAAAVVRISGSGLDLQAQHVHSLHVPYSREARDLLREASGSSPVPTRHIAILHRVLGELFAGAARQVVGEARCDLSQVWCLGCSGHTLWHEPDCRYPTTLNLGLAGAVAERTGVTTLGDPRGRDVAIGGLGIPLTPLADWLLFHDAVEPRVLVHLGGTTTVVALPAGTSPRAVFGFTAGPGGLLLDSLMRRLTAGKELVDSGGRHAVQGRTIEPLLERWLALPSLQKKPPRTISSRDFGDDFVDYVVRSAQQSERSSHDLLCTATHFVARAVVDAVRRFVPWTPARVLLSGGGVRNGFLLRLLAQGLAPTPVEPVERWGIPNEARKATAFAVLAALTMDCVPGNLPAVTGARGPRLLGSFTPGTPANWARCLAWMARHASYNLRAGSPLAA